MTETTAKLCVFSMGLSPKHKGFHYLSRAFEAAYAGMDVAGACKSVEPGGDPQRADRCMRYAIQYAWYSGEGALHSLFPHYTHPPTPVELIHALIWKVEEERASQPLRRTKQSF